MIAVIDVEIQAANPSMPLYPWRAFVGSPSSLRIRNVPKRVGNWNIDKVYVSASYPDNSIQSSQCVLVGGVWVCTINGTQTSGYSKNGYSVLADGKDENGNEVTGYCLGKGDITILEADGQITPGETTYYVHMLSSEPTNPKDGDLYQISGSWYIYQDNQAWPIGDDSGLISELSAELSSKADVSSLTAYEPISSLYNDVSSFVLSSTEGEWTITNQTEWNFLRQPKYEGDNIWGADFIRGPDIAPVMADGDENATSLHFDDGIEIDVYAEKGDSRNILGIVTYDYLSTELSTKQDKLTDIQLSSIDYVANEYMTTIKFIDGTSEKVEIVGEINQVTLDPFFGRGMTDIKIGTLVNVIGNDAFDNFSDLSNVFIPETVHIIDDYAFVNASALSTLTIPNSVSSIGIDAFHENLTVTFIGKTMNEVSSMANYSWGLNASNIKTWNAASQEWVDQQLASLEPKYKLTTLTANANTISCEANAINTYVPSAASQLSIYMPPQVSGYVRDCILRLDQSQLTSSLSVSFMGGTFETEDGSMPELEVGAVNLISFTETVAGKFDVSHKVVKEIE